jgi:uncharacterized protein DUF6178
MTKGVRRRRVDADPGVPANHDAGRLIDRVLASPHLPSVVPRLQPQVLHRVIQRCGLEDCGQLLALATPDQLARVFDLDLWRPAAPGSDEQFDAARFGTWLEVMVETSLPGAAATLAAMDVDLAVAGLAEHVRVFDYAAAAPFVTLDGEVSPGSAVADGLRSEVGGYVVSAKRSEFWDVITAVLNALAETHGAYFTQVMRGCCRLSNSRPEIDGLDSLLTTDEQTMFDLATDRETRRDIQGYVTPAHARAFLQTSRRVDIRHGGMPARDPMTLAYFKELEARVAMERDLQPLESSPDDHVGPAADAPAEAVAAIVDLLHEAGALPRASRPLLESPQTGVRLTQIRACLQFAHDCDPGAYASRSAELAYLANVIVAGSTLQSRPVAEEEASEAALAVCNLGLENWPARWLAGGLPASVSGVGVARLPEDFLTRHDLVTVFQVGWTVLFEDVCMYAADRLIGVVASIHSADGHVQAALETLRIVLTKHCRAGSPWDSRDALDVIAVLDTPSWVALLALIDRFPTLHAAVGALLSGTSRQIDPAAFEFISENAQVQTVRDFMERLPALLR